MEVGQVKIGDVIKAGLPDEPVIVLDILKSETTEHIAAITQPLRTIERSRKTYELTGREKLLKKLEAEEIIQTLRSDGTRRLLAKRHPHRHRFPG